MARLTGSLLVDGNVIAESLTGSVQGTATTASYIAGANVDGNVANATNVYITNYPGYDGDQRIAFVGGVNQYNSVRADTEFNFNPGQNKLSVPNVNATTLTGSLDWDQLDNIPDGIISSSDGIVPDGTVSSSAQVDLASATGTAAVATRATRVDTVASSFNSEQEIIFTDGVGNSKQAKIDTELTYNSSTNRLTVSKVNATELTGSLDWDNLDNVPSGLMSASDANDATITLSAGTGLSGGGNFTTNQSGNETITFNVGTAPQADLVKINSHNGNDTGFMAFMTGSGTHRSVNISSAFIYTPTLSNEGATDGTLQAEDVYFDVRSLGTANNTKIRVGNFTGNLSSEFSYTGNLLRSASEFYIGEGGGYVWNKLLHDNEGVISSSAQVNLSEAAGSVTTAATASYVSGSNVDGEVYEAERARRIEVGSYGSYSNLTDIPFITGDYGSNIKRISSDGVLRWHAGQDALWVPNISASNAITSSYLHVKDNAFIQGRLNLQHDRFGAGTYSVLIGEDSGETGFESSNINFTENTMIGTGAGRYVAANSNLNTFVGFNTARTYDGAARSVMNTAFGYNAMYNLGSGSSVTHQGNTAIGARALNHPGGSNTGLGYHALHTDALIGNDNIGIGAYAGSQLEGGSGNIYIGSFSGPSSDTNENYKLYINSGSGTPLIGGDFSARTVTIDGGITATSITGSFSVDYYDIDNIPVSTSNPITPVLHIPNGSVDRGLVAIGNGVLTNAISASNLPFGSVVIGKDAGAGLNAGLLGSDNIVIGRQAMENYGNQIDNCLNLSIVVGAYAGFNSSGTENVTLGGQSYTSGSGNNNTILGTWAANGYGFTGDSNTIIGHQAGGNSAAGVGIKGDSNKNTIVGASATVRQGSCNVLIGYGAGSDTDFSNKLYIENGGSTPLIEGDFSTNHIKINDVLELNQSDPLPSGGVGQLAVSASNLYFHNGSSWSQIN